MDPNQAMPFTTKTEWVYNEIKSMIRSGKLKPDDRLRLNQLAKSFNTSEMPVREALRMLQRDGLIEIQTHRGATVVNLSLERVYEIVVVRTHLEILALREATPHHTPQTLAKLERLLERMDRMAERDQPDPFSEANRAFHVALYEPCRMSVLKTEIQELWDRVWRARARSLFSLQPKRMAEAQAEHWAVLRAVARADVDAAVAELQTHRDRTIAAWRRLVDTAEPSREH